MNTIKKLGLAAPLLVAVLAMAPPARATDIRDEAGLFDRQTVLQARQELNRIEREYRVPVLIETIDGIPNRASSAAERRAQLNDLAIQRDRQNGNRGIYILIDKNDKMISEVLVPGWLGRHFGKSRGNAVRAAFITGFRAGDFNAGLTSGVRAIRQELAAAQAEAGGPLNQQGRGAAPQRGGVPRPMGPVARPRAGGSGFAALIGIVLVILAIVFVIRLLGSLFRPAGMGPGMGPGPARMGGPGYGGGYGGYGGGGGFWSSLFGGIGGAMAGNWIYDQMTGRHHGGGYDAGSYGPAAGADYDAGGAGDNEIVSASDSGGPGPDWGGGDGGGGGDWGGGGGDWGGGGGGDWGGGGDGGGGGGDW